MLASRHRRPYWRRKRSPKKFDIAKLRPKTRPRSQRFETSNDGCAESLRSQALLGRSRVHQAYGVALEECREGHYHCDKTFCPICARKFRQYFIGQLLRLNSEFCGKVRILVVLLKSASKGSLEQLRIEGYRHSLRKKLARAGLGSVSIIGCFEVCYRARSKEWVLHINLVIFGGRDDAIDTFMSSFSEGEIYRPVVLADLKDDAEQLSYVLKFATYHRPYEQIGSKKSKAVPLNPSEHFELVRWMDQYEFSDFVLLHNARRCGVDIRFSSKAVRKA